MRKLKKVLAILLIMGAILPVLPKISFAKPTLIEIVSDKEVFMAPSETAVLQVQTQLTETLIWQIYVPNQDIWADIQGKTGNQCEVNYALLYNALNENHEALLRCRAGEEYSKEFTVSLTDHMPALFSQTPTNNGVLEMTPTDREILGAQPSENGNAQQFTVTVEFLFYKNQQPVDKAWTAVVSKQHGTILNVTVPTVTGYSAFFQGSKLETNVLPLDISDLSGDVTYIVYFNAADVKYRVRHHLQNVDNDSYVLRDTIEHMGPTDSQVGVVEREYEGFKPLLYERPIIAADGTTILDVFYDRCYYLVNFNLGEDGYGVHPIYARYEAKLEIGTPVRAGYSFLGWNPEVPATVASQNQTYTAVWKAADTAQVSVVLWGENANDEGYAYLDTYLHTAKPGTKIHVTEKGILTCTQHVHDETCSYSCNQEYHVHSSACCSVPAHNHSAACCTIPEYTHTEEKECFGNCEHPTHSYTCYGGTGTTTPTSTDLQYLNTLGVENGYVYRVSRDSYINGYVHWYLYLDKQWYSVSSTAVGEEDMVQSGSSGYYPQYDYEKYNVVLHCPHVHSDSCLSCTKPMHVHDGVSCDYCDKTPHDHTADCRYCDLEEHTHDGCTLTCGEANHVHQDSCYKSLPADLIDESEYYYVRSTKVRVELDGSTVVDVYYDRTTVTMTFRETSANGGDLLGTITAKWGAYIRDEFQAISNAHTFLWSANSSGNSPWTSFVNEMPKEKRTYYANIASSSNVQKATYYGEVVGTPKGDYVVVDGVKYEPLFTTAVKYRNNLTVSAEEFEKIDGYVFNASRSTKTGAPYNGAKFYYDRESFEIDFSDGYKIIESEIVDYGNDLAAHAAHVPHVPEALDQNGYYFAGWYLNPECTGKIFDLTKETMPAKDLILYAKWEAKTHRVQFYKDNSLKEELASYEVLHNKHLQDYPQNVTNGNYTFLYWFYMDGTTERAFDPVNMPIMQDMRVYAKWSNNAMRPCQIHYETPAGVKIAGSTVWVADLSTGSATKTFEAKGPSELYDGYQHGWFPEVRSHSVVMTMESANSYTFVYKEVGSVGYTVRYVKELSDGTLKDLAPKKVVTDNHHAVVTETSVAVDGYQADAYQKRLIVVANPDEEIKNELIFYYSESTGDSALEYIRVSHFVETLNGAWKEFQATEMAVPVNTQHKATPLDIPGFTYDDTLSNPQGTVVVGGIHLKLYYSRNSYHYVVRHLNVSNQQPLIGDEKSTIPVKFESLVTVQAKESIVLNGVTYVPAEVKHTTVSIRHDDKDNPELNVITFYYEEKTAQIRYEIVGPAGCGSLSVKTENVPMYSGEAAGSIPTANDGFRFVGWFYDAACTQQVDPTQDTVIDGKLIPQKKDGAFADHTYFAKFSATYATLTIQNSGTNALDNGQAYLYRITNDDDFDLTIVVQGDKAVTIQYIPAGTYTVTQMSDWSWRYEPDEQSTSVVLQGGKHETLNFANQREQEYWLDGNNIRENLFH